MEKENEMNKCGKCLFWKTEKCPYLDDARKGILKKGDNACNDFFLDPKEKQKKKILKDSGICSDGCFEAIYHNAQPCFLVSNNATFHIHETMEVNGENFQPKETKHIPYEPYEYFEGQVPNDEDIFWMIYQEFKSFVDVENIWKEILSTFVLLSYNQEKFQTVPYIFLYGDNESGKSTVLQLLKFLCYRPMYGVTVPSADIYGYLEDNDGISCILEDEIQGIHKDIDKIKVYKAGYKQGAKVPRTLITQDERIIKYYNTFCAKVCASEQIPQVKGFRERFIEISMIEGFPDKEWADITNEDLERLRNLRNMLLKWRMLKRMDVPPNIEVSMKGRLKELWKPLLQISHNLSVHKDLADFVENQKNERLNTKQATLEGHIVKVIVNIYNQSNESIQYVSFQTIWSELADDLDGKIDDKKPHTMDTSEFFQITKNKIGYRLREILSGKSKSVRQKDSEGNDVIIKAYTFESEKVRRVAKKYGYEFVTKLPTLLSSEGVQAPKTMEKIDENNVENESSTPTQLGKLSNLVTTNNGLEPYFQQCYFCGDPIYENDWIANGQTENRPSHKCCFERKFGELKNHE